MLGPILLPSVRQIQKRQPFALLTSKTNGTPRSHPKIPKATPVIREANQNSKRPDIEIPPPAEECVTVKIDTTKAPTTHVATTQPTSPYASRFHHGTMAIAHPLCQVASSLAAPNLR
jgi:hypothetical protein